jgi:RND family efflux transporter MFP subunit
VKITSSNKSRDALSLGIFMKRLTMVSLALAGAVAVIAGCSKEPAAGATAVAASAPASGAASAVGGGPVSVTTMRAQKRDVEVMLEATGTVTALNSVDIRSQVSSVITKVNIREGQFVKAGDTLFTLDARNDQVNLAKAQAQLAKDLAALADAQRQLARNRDLLAQNFISQGAVDTSQTQVESQQAVVTADKAAIEAAKVGLGYNRITAPAAGRAGAINVYAGTTVQPGGTSLVTITQLAPIAVSFSLPQRNLNDALQTMRAGGGKVVAVLPEGRNSLTGKLQFVDNSVDANSGTVKVKAQFDNTDEALWPGAFVNVRLAVRTLKDATVVPQASVIQGPRGTIVYVVDAQNKAAARPIEVVYASGLDAAITGVQPGEKVVVDGRQNLRNGASVAERAASGPGGSASGAGRARAASGASGSGASSAASAA